MARGFKPPRPSPQIAIVDLSDSTLTPLTARDIARLQLHAPAHNLHNFLGAPAMP
jgi:hypothetical protein